MPSDIRQFIAPVVKTKEIIPDHHVLTFNAPFLAETARPGHFVNVLAAEGFDPLLRKPFSVYTVDRDSGDVSILFSIVGPTTRAMAQKRPGDTIDLVGPLGDRLFRPDTRSGTLHVMVGGGYGVPPLVFLANELRIADPEIDLFFIIGARHDGLLLCEAELRAAHIATTVSTENGSRGVRGRVTDVLLPLLEENANRPLTVYCCGPTPMMRAVGDLCLSREVPCQLSVEVRMPCGVGVCMACVIDLTDGRRVRCCTDGPVFEAGEVVW